MRRAALALVLALPLASGVAHADARDVSARLLVEWKAAGARTTALPTKFLFDEETTLVPVPPTDAKCTVVAIVAARGLSFRARLSDAPTDPLLPPDPGARAQSAAGILELRRCDGARVRHVVITTEAGRGALEIVVAQADRAPPPLATLVPERSGGSLPPMPEAGPLPALTPPERRAEIAERRAHRDGATTQPRVTIHASDDGGGEDDLALEEGCHRVEVFGREPPRDRPGRRFRLDIDAELKDGDHLLSRDRTEAPDARLETCLGAPTKVTLGFAGAIPQSELVVARARWPLPEHLPSLWGPATKARLARVFFVRHVAPLPDEPVFLAVGSTGTTPVSLPVETGGCYVAAVGIVRGKARQLQLRAIAGARESVDERGAAEEAALASFCVRDEEQPVRLEILARGTGVSWGLAVYRLKSAAWESGR